jgi:hypothetical protein
LGEQNKKNEMAGCLAHMGRREIHTGFWWELKERDHFEDLGMDGSTILKWILNKYVGRAWTGLMRCRTETSGSLF